MSKRSIVKIDEEKCNGCGLCVPSCAEGAIQIIDGKARLVKETYCDGLGACLGHCPQDAITIEERDADNFNEDEVKEHLARLGSKSHAPASQPTYAAPAQTHQPSTGGCPGTMARQFARPAAHTHSGGGCPGSMARMLARPPQTESQTGATSTGSNAQSPAPSELTQWPVQLALVPPNAPYFQDADLLLAADCAPFAYADFHRGLLRGKALAIGCPKLDDTSFYVNKLTSILSASNIRSLTVVRMEVPCCGGLMRIAQVALAQSGKDIPLKEITIGLQGDILSEK